MNAKQIHNIIKEFPQSPYTCILIDGAWGIGKTYEIKQITDDMDNACYISLFGVKSSQQVYHNILASLMFKNDTMQKVGETISRVGSAVKKIIDKEDIVCKLISEEDIVNIKLRDTKGNKKVLVFDDLERIGNKFDLSELFAIIDSLKQEKSIKVILVCNQMQFNEEAKNTFNAYLEKIIDKAYTIDTISEDINWGELKIDRKFILSFLQKHKVNNIRTLKKAQDLFEDIKAHISADYSIDFYNEIRQICFSIVIEDVDKLYINESEKYDNKDDLSSNLMIQILNNPIDRIIHMYLQAIRVERGLIVLIYDYYNKGNQININEVNEYYRIFLSTCEKADYYKSDEEIKETIDILIREIDDVNNIGVVVSIANRIAIWAEVLELGLDEIKETIRNNINKSFERCIKNNELEEILNGDCRESNSALIKEVYGECLKKARRSIVKDKIERIRYIFTSKEGTDSYIEAYEEAVELTRILDSQYEVDKNTYIKELLSELLIKEIFPIGSTEKKKYETTKQIVRLMKRYIGNELKDYCYNLKEQYANDKMFNNRLKNLLE